MIFLFDLVNKKKCAKRTIEKKSRAFIPLSSLEQEGGDELSNHRLCDTHFSTQKSLKQLTGRLLSRDFSGTCVYSYEFCDESKE